MNCIIIHGRPKDIEKARDPTRRTFDKHWMPWVKSRLEKRGIKTNIPIMPEPWAPNYNRYRELFESQHIDSNTILIGHSCGCSFLTRWLSDSNVKISKLILVAPWKIASQGDRVLFEFYNYELNKAIRRQVGSITYFTSDNERPGGSESLNIFFNALGGQIYNLKE